MSPFAALLAATGVAGLAFLARALAPSGVVAASLVGTAVLWSQGWSGAAVLVAFFVPTSLLSRLLPDTTARFDAKGNKRDAGQVLANGAAAAIGALCWPHQPAGLMTMTAAFAAAAADTWATSLGSGSRVPPRSILTGRVVPSGTSGGITARGAAGAALGAALVAVTGGLVSRSWVICLTALFIGVAGMLADSLIGAAGQARFYCSTCQRATEQARHSCGTASELRGGIRWLGNDAVNALATTLAALGGLIAWLLLRPS